MVGGPALAAARAAIPAALADSTIATAFNTFLTTLTDTGIGDSVQRILGDLDVVLTGVSDPRDPDGAAKASMVALVDILEQVTLVILRAMDRVVAALVALVQAVASNIGTVLDYPLSLGPVNTIYRWIQTQNGITKPEGLTLGRLAFLIAGFAVTTAHKLINGVEAAPFPNGVFPELAAPPWHPDHDPHRADPPSYEEVKNRNASLKKLQEASGFFGVFGGVFDLAADLAPLFGESTKGIDTLGMCIAGLSTVLSAGLFGVVSSCPPVTGLAWGAAGGAWDGAFAMSSVGMAMSVGSITEDPECRSGCGRRSDA